MLKMLRHYIILNYSIQTMSNIQDMYRRIEHVTDFAGSSYIDQRQVLLSRSL